MIFQVCSSIFTLSFVLLLVIIPPPHSRVYGYYSIHHLLPIWNNPLFGSSTTSCISSSRFYDQALRMSSSNQEAVPMGGDDKVDSDDIITPSSVLLSTPQDIIDMAHMDEKDDSINENLMPIYQKVHTSTVCMVPPEDNTFVWEQLSKARLQLRDPGYYRWPPHANLLYPFVNLSRKVKKIDSESVDPNDRFETCLETLAAAVKQIEPFDITLDALGTFGGKKRGVLWMYPRSFRNDNCSTRLRNEPLVELQSLLRKAFPLCHDQHKTAGLYNPHITLTHCINLDKAETLKNDIETWWKPISFRCSKIYLLERSGDDGQFKILASIRLGINMTDEETIEVFDPPRPFSSMPETEEQWVCDERMKLKKRRKSRGRSRRRGNSPNRNMNDASNME